MKNGTAMARVSDDEDGSDAVDQSDGEDGDDEEAGHDEGYESEEEDGNI